MKLFKYLMVGFAIVVFVFSFACISQADCGHCPKDKEKQIKTLKDSAAALQKSHPELAKGLTEIVDMKEAHMKKSQERWEAVSMTLKEAAAALQTSNPEVSKKLSEYADMKMDMKMMEGKGMGEMKLHKEAKIKLFREAAAALQTMNPVLADKLTALADKKEMMLKWGMEKDEAEDEMEEEMPVMD